MLRENYKQAVKAFETKVFLDIMKDHQATQAASTTLKNLTDKPLLDEKRGRKQCRESRFAWVRDCGCCHTLYEFHFIYPGCWKLSAKQGNWANTFR